tara:strand:+ start:803 stop:1207 length:405 start_codon:yes stop_codon:yes gene_type:complete
MQLSKTDFLALTNKNDLSITFSSAFSVDNEVVLIPSSKPRFSKKYNLHKLTLTNKNNLTGAKFYAYLRGENITFAYSDMAIIIKSIEILKTPACKKVLQLMDQDFSYSKALKKVLLENNKVKKQDLETELNIFI